MICASALAPCQSVSGTPILTFHDIIPAREASSLWFDCSQGEFVGILDWLQKRRAHFISLDQLYAHLTQGKPLPPHAICLTFADGYLGFYQRAVPILRARRIPATMFVHTGFVGSSVGRPKMNWQHLKELDREGLIKIESQTLSHPPDLRRLNPQALEREMRLSKATLERQLGHRITMIAYPNGKWDLRSVQAARAAGYSFGFTEVLRPATAKDNLLALPRYVHTQFRRAWSDAYHSK